MSDNYGVETYLDFDASWATFASGEYQEEGPSGVPMWKLSDDLARYLTLLAATTPQVVVEVGSKWGGTALWFQQQGAEVVAVDIDDSYRRDAKALGPGIHWVTGDSIDPAVVSQVAELVAGRTCMVSLDGEHAAPHVAREIKLYGPLVTPGQYLVVEDGIFDLAPRHLAHLGGSRIPAEGGPLKAISELLVGNPEWERDVELEQLTDRSYHPAAFWRRKEGETGR